MSARFIHRLRHCLPVWLTLVAGLALSGALGWELHQEAVKLDADRFDLETRQIAAALESNMERYEERLARLADHCAQFEELPTQVWSFRQAAMTDLEGNLPAVRHALYCPKVVATNFQRHLDRGQLVWGGRYQFDPTPQPRRDLALPAWQVWGRSGFTAIARGTDMAAETNGHPSLRLALGTGRGWVSRHPVQAARHDGTIENGFWFALTLFASNQTVTVPSRRPNETPAQSDNRLRAFRRSAATGLLAVFLSADHLVDRAFNSTNRPARIHARLYAERSPSPAALLNPVSQPPKNPWHRSTLAQSWYGRRWCLEFASTPLFEAESLRYRAWLALVGGGTFTLLATALIGVSLRAHKRQERMTAEVTEARDALAAAEKERVKLGHDLHDGAIQSLYAIQLGLTRTAENVEALLPSSACVLNETRERMNEVIAELRRFILAREADAPSEEPVGLDRVLAAMVQRLQPTTKAVLQLHANTDAAGRLSVVQVVQLTQIARSALANSLRHAQARRVDITLGHHNGFVRLEIADDGAGFDLSRSATGGMGLQTMRARATEAGGTLELDSRPGAGTRVVVILNAPHHGTEP